MGTTHEPLHLDKRNLEQRKIMDTSTVLFERLFSLTELLSTAVVWIKKLCWYKRWTI
jgi:hypothetical protein